MRLRNIAPLTHLIQKSLSRAQDTNCVGVSPTTLFHSDSSSAETVFEPSDIESCRVYHKPLFEMFNVDTMNSSLPSDVLSFSNREHTFMEMLAMDMVECVMNQKIWRPTHIS